VCLRLRRAGLVWPSIGEDGGDASSSGRCDAFSRLPGLSLTTGHYDGCAACFGSGAGSNRPSKHGHRHVASWHDSIWATSS
jgi:hypothetical protein